MRNAGLWVMIVLLAVACSPRGTLTMAPQAATVGEVRSVFVGTTRGMDPETGEFSGDRSETDRYARFDISIPPERTSGEITWPKPHLKPNFTTDFLTTAANTYPDPTSFRRDLTAALSSQRPGQREAVVYVHGFNNTFSEGLYRIAQLSHDLEMPGVAVHYSWPSLGKPLAYVYDRDSVLFARDGLQDLLEQVAAAGADRIVIVGHSMGSALVMEALRQMAIRGGSKVWGRIAGVVLISPDIDVEVFRSQALRIGTLPQPFLIFTSQKDKALALSARLTGQKERLGTLEDVSLVADLKVTLFEVGAFSTGAGHFTPGDSPVLIQLLGRLADVDAAFARDQTGRTDLISGTVLTLQQATRIVLSPVTALADELAGGQSARR
jgi:esterase/lipase superfamily enzyme